MSEAPEPKPLAEMAEAALRITLHAWGHLTPTQMESAAQAAEALTRVLDMLDVREPFGMSPDIKVQTGVTIHARGTINPKFCEDLGVALGELAKRPEPEPDYDATLAAAEAANVADREKRLGSTMPDSPGRCPPMPHGLGRG